MTPTETTESQIFKPVAEENRLSVFVLEIEQMTYSHWVLMQEHIKQLPNRLTIDIKNIKKVEWSYSSYHKSWESKWSTHAYSTIKTFF